MGTGCKIKVRGLQKYLAKVAEGIPQSCQPFGAEARLSKTRLAIIAENLPPILFHAVVFVPFPCILPFPFHTYGYIGFYL